MADPSSPPLVSVTVATPSTPPVTWSLTRAGAACLAVLAVVVGLGLGGWYAVSTWTAAPTLTVGDVQGEPGKHIRLHATGNASDVRWISSSADLELAPHADLLDAKTMHVTASKPGVYQVLAVPVHHGHLGEAIPVKVTVGQPGPDPIPPGPGPGPGPGPTPPSPIPADGFRVLIVYDAAGLGKLPKEQEAILYAKSIRDYLQGKCAVGADGKTKEFRIWPATVNATAESKLWQDAMARPRAAAPSILISTGKSGYEGPLPATVDATLTLLQKFGG